MRILLLCVVCGEARWRREIRREEIVDILKFETVYPASDSKWVGIWLGGLWLVMVLWTILRTNIYIYILTCLVTIGFKALCLEQMYQIYMHKPRENKHWFKRSPTPPCIWKCWYVIRATSLSQSRHLQSVSLENFTKDQDCQLPFPLAFFGWLARK